MGHLFDLLLKSPISERLLAGLLFTSFTLHLLFVLLTIGTAILAFYLFLHGWYAGRLDELRWDKEVLKTFIAHKSLAVVLGVAPLLLIQVGYSLPFFISINLFAPFWILIIVFLIIAFLIFDVLAHRGPIHPFWHFLLGGIGLISLVFVPGIFVAVLLTSENYTHWLTIATNGYQLRGLLTPYWLFRYLHVLGASVVFGAAFHYLFTVKNDENNRALLLKWIVGGMLLQMILGLLLYASLPFKPEPVTIVFILLGLLFASVMLWTLFFRVRNNEVLNVKTTVPLLMLILISMLISRQFIQDRTFLPLSQKLQQDASHYERGISPYAEKALGQYRAHLQVVYDKGQTIYSGSCAFCHGENAKGQGPEADKLGIPPEDIAAIRTTPSYFHQILIEGVPGSAMPYFTFFDGDKLRSLMDGLNQNYHVFSMPKPVPVTIPKPAEEKANRTYAETCSSCHGTEGWGTRFSEGFKPKPPNFTLYSLSPQRAFDVITHGYPGTMMSQFNYLPEDVRWALVKIVNGKRGL
jgi:mono/diheme cytochrome c family protein